ncbi:dipeptidase E [Gilliamella sp. wkB108]|uniref:dipeptidase PepE n=1 Tax=Gilliamella sp. wkB108 TaxID=3120256 RepID=UPI00080E3B2D|nr:dipeptidase E [Gilliamella apicola]
MKLLLLSNSKLPNKQYLEYALKPIKQFIGEKKHAIFVPYAGVTQSWDDYTTKVQSALASLSIEITGIHTLAEPINAIEQTEIIIVGGGNTYNLLKQCRENKIIEAIQQKVKQNGLYIGWSAGANLACPTICTTNDMPIVDPKGFDSLNLIDYQINPHYTNALPQGHQGETRDDRIAEFLVAQPNYQVIGLPEGDWLVVENGQSQLHGSKPAFRFKSDHSKEELPVGSQF